MRINKYLAQCGLASRRSAEKLILDGRVTINGKPVDSLATQVSPTDVVKVDKKRVLPERKKLVVLLNKPRGVITTARDEKGRKTVFDLVQFTERLFAVGRLDANSEGLLLLTNDGELAFRLTHPRYKVDKVYRVKLNTAFSPADFDAFSRGIDLKDGRTTPCKAHFYTHGPDRVEIILREGRYHQVRRMFEALGYQVDRLKRVRYGPVELGDIVRGKWRLLTAKEMSLLHKSVGLES